MPKIKVKKYEAPNPTAKVVMATCACGAAFEVVSTLDTVRVDICAKCHPFFTGESRMVDAEGRIEKFKKKYQLK